MELYQNKQMLSNFIILIIVSLLFGMVQNVPLLSKDSKISAKGAMKRVVKPDGTVLMASSCEAKPYNYTISGGKGCNEIRVRANYCIGSCISVFVPQSGEPSFSRCTACLPKNPRRKALVFTCPGQKERYKVKEVNIVTECECKIIAC